jgi:gamma-glutamylputrescine oxidase
MSISYWLDQSPQKPKKKYDFVIIGGGIAGLSTAYWLQKDYPNAKIALLEKDRIGFGASGRNAGFVTCGSLEHFIKLQTRFRLPKALEIWKFSEENRRLLVEHIIEDQADALQYQQNGSCTVAPSPAHWETYQEAAQIMKTNRLDVQVVAASTLEADYGIKGFEGGVVYKGDGSIHPVRLLERLKSKLNVDIFEHTEVFQIEDDKGTQKIKTDQGVFEAPKVLLTLNAYLPMVLKEFKSLLFPQRSQILMTEPLQNFVKGPCYLTKLLCYFRQLPTGELLVGGFRNLSLETESTSLDQTTPVIQEALYQFIKDHFKLGKKAKVAYQWSGIMGFTPDEQMLIGASPNNPHIHLMAGCSGHGMGLSFHAAKVLVESLSGKPIPSHLDIRRFP